MIRTHEGERREGHKYINDQSTCSHIASTQQHSSQTWFGGTWQNMEIFSRTASCSGDWLRHTI
eukprot:m.189195 g.189195  ORF g.189195 m.189195 type:complete len:63 (+) comp15425_c0_seq8:2335-2523(+)